MPNESSDPPFYGLGAGTIDYLDKRASESFKRQQDLEESIWRSVPLITGALLAASALMGSAVRHLPPPSSQPFAIAVYVVSLLALFAFGLSFVRLWPVVLSREYDYPPDDAAMAAYAKTVADYHAQAGLRGDELDDAVLYDLKTQFAETFALAASSTFTNNRVRLNARSQVVRFLLIGFVLAFCDGALIYVHGAAAGSAATDVSGHVTRQQVDHASANGVEGPALAPADARGNGRTAPHRFQQRPADPK